MIIEFDLVEIFYCWVEVFEIFWVVVGIDCVIGVAVECVGEGDDVELLWIVVYEVIVVCCFECIFYGFCIGVCEEYVVSEGCVC